MPIASTCAAVCMSPPPAWPTFLQAKNRLNLQIMDVVHKDGCDFAFPTTTIEMAEKK